MPILANDKMRLIVTGKCNLNCFYCHNEGQAKEDSFIRVDEVGAIVEAFRSRRIGIGEVTISGGEPLLHPHVDAIVALVASVSSRVTMVSNGLLATSRRLEQLAGSGLDKLRLGIDSLQATKPRPSPGRLDQLFSASGLLAAAGRAGLRVDLNVVVTKFNRREIGPLIRFAVGNGVSVKFFEHVEVRTYGGGGRGGAMASAPHVTYEEFRHRVDEGVGVQVTFRPDVEFGEANMTAVVDGIEIRYCRYLCDFGLCWMTGTRVDARRYVYNCMSNRGLDRMSIESSDAIVESLAAASTKPCGSRVESAQS